MQIKVVYQFQVQDALGDMALELMAVVATLKMRFAEAVTLGASIGMMIEKGVLPYASPALKKLMPEEYHKWTPFIISTCTKLVCTAAPAHAVSLASRPFFLLEALEICARASH